MNEVSNVIALLLGVTLLAFGVASQQSLPYQRAIFTLVAFVVGGVASNSRWLVLMVVCQFCVVWAGMFALRGSVRLDDDEARLAIDRQESRP